MITPPFSMSAWPDLTLNVPLCPCPLLSGIPRSFYEVRGFVLARNLGRGGTMTPQSFVYERTSPGRVGGAVVYKRPDGGHGRAAGGHAGGRGVGLRRGASGR